MSMGKPRSSKAVKGEWVMCLTFNHMDRRARSFGNQKEGGYFF